MAMKSTVFLMKGVYVVWMCGKKNLSQILASKYFLESAYLDKKVIFKAVL
jgi:hypothetical protein